VIKKYLKISRQVKFLLRKYKQKEHQKKVEKNFQKHQTFWETLRKKQYKYNNYSKLQIIIFHNLPIIFHNRHRSRIFVIRLFFVQKKRLPKNRQPQI